MIEKVKTYWDQVISTGTSPEMPPDRIHRFRLSNQVGIICGLSTFSYGWVFMAWAPPILVSGVFIQSVLFFLTLFFSYRRKDLGAALWLVTLISVYVFFYASFFGREGGSHLVLLPILFAVPILLDLDKFKIVAAYAFIPLLVFIALEVTDYSLLKSLIDIPFPEGFRGNLYALNLFLAIFASLIVLYYNYYFFKQKVQALREREMALVQTSRMGKIGYCDVDLINREILWSPELKEILGIPEYANPGIEDGLRMIIKGDRERVAENLARVSQIDMVPAEGFLKEDFSLVRKGDGKKLYLSSAWNVWPNASGKPIKMTVVIKDITQEKEAEQAIQAEKELAIEANQAKSRFLTNMSHEIRTPLNGILGFTDLLLQSELEHDQRDHIQLIQSSGDTLLALLSDLLDLSKIEAGKLKLEEKTFNFFETAQTCISPYQAQAQEKGLSLKCDIDSDIPAYVYADPIRIKQIIVNLLSNAIKYTQDGFIQVSLKAIGLKEEEDYFILEGSVKDTGIGIPENEQNDIFTAFGQSSMTTVEEYGGTGLGLAIVNELVRMMSGSVRVKSPIFHTPKDFGSRFTFWIRIQKAAAPQGEAGLNKNKYPIPNGAQKPLEGLFILIAEDNEINQILAKKVLENLGAEVEVVENGQEAVDFIANKPADIILMDIKMPVMNGYEATGIIRQSHPQLPIIALSANAYKEDIDASFAAGMNGHISKPFRPEQLLEVIARLEPQYSHS